MPLLHLCRSNWYMSGHYQVTWLLYCITTSNSISSSPATEVGIFLALEFVHTLLHQQIVDSLEHFFILALTNPMFASMDLVVMHASTLIQFRIWQYNLGYGTSG